MSAEWTEHDRCQIRSFRPLAAFSATVLLSLVACSRSPDYSVFGSFFPAWIFCAIGGLLLMAGARALIARTAIAEHLAAPMLFYLSMSVFLTCMLWLLFYS